MIAFGDELPCGSDDAMAGDPTPDEIARRAAKIRSKWSEAELMRRRVAAPKDCIPPTVDTSEPLANASSIQANGRTNQSNSTI